MKIRVEVEVDMQTGTYDVRFHNISHPGEAIDLAKLSKVVARVLDNVVAKTERKSSEVPAVATPFKINVN